MRQWESGRLQVYNFSVLGQILPTALDRCTLNRGAFAFKIVRGDPEVAV